MESMVTIVLENGETMTVPADKVQNMAGWKPPTKEEADRIISNSLGSLKEFMKGSDYSGPRFEERPVWRDSSGRIDCPGEESCTNECDETCPIKLSTDASIYFQCRRYDKAITLFKKAIDLASDFYDPWNNLGVIYGAQKNFEEAYKCYTEAHKIRPDKIPPVLGLALSCCDMGNYAECIKWCDEYDSMTDEHKCDNVRAVSKAEMEKSNRHSNYNTSNLTADIDFTTNVINVCEELQVIASVYFPPLLNRKNMKCSITKLVEFTPAIADCLAKEVEDIYWDEEDCNHPEAVLEYAPLWGVYSGIGAVISWDEGLRPNDGIRLYKLLVGHRDLDDLVEYIAEYLGDDPKSEGYQELQRNIMKFGQEAIYICVREFAEKHNLHPMLRGQLAVMYNIGLLIGMWFLGLDN